MLEIIVGIFVVILLLFLSFIVINHTVLFAFLYVEYNLGTLHSHDKYPPIPLTHFIKKYWVELWFQLDKYYLWPFKYVCLTLNRKHHHTAVLLIHGYCRHQGDWLLFRRKLRSTGLPIYTINLKPGLAPIEKITKQSLPAKIALIKEQTNCKKIILIGHSMGGLVASYYATHLDDENLISTIITIGTPFYGTRVAVAGAGPNAKQMCPGSKFLENLRQHVHSSHKQFLQIATRLDNLVFPWYSSLLETLPENHKFILKDEAHLSMLHNKQVVTQVRKWLQAYS